MTTIQIGVILVQACVFLALAVVNIKFHRMRRGMREDTERYLSSAKQAALAHQAADVRRAEVQTAEARLIALYGHNKPPQPTMDVVEYLISRDGTEPTKH